MAARDPHNVYIQSRDPSSRTFFYNVASRKSQWAQPPQGSEIWVEGVDPSSGRRFYHNPATGTSSWNRPTVRLEEPKRTADEGEGPTPDRAAPVRRVRSVDGQWVMSFDVRRKRPYFYDSSSGKSQWTPPRGTTFPEAEMARFLAEWQSTTDSPPAGGKAESEEDARFLQSHVGEWPPRSPESMQAYWAAMSRNAQQQRLEFSESREEQAGKPRARLPERATPTQSGSPSDQHTAGKPSSSPSSHRRRAEEPSSSVKSKPLYQEAPSPPNKASPATKSSPAKKPPPTKPSPRRQYRRPRDPNRPTQLPSYVSDRIKQALAQRTEGLPGDPSMIDSPALRRFLGWPEGPAEDEPEKRRERGKKVSPPSRRSSSSRPPSSRSSPTRPASPGSKYSPPVHIPHVDLALVQEAWMGPNFSSESAHILDEIARARANRPPPPPTRGEDDDGSATSNGHAPGRREGSSGSTQPSGVMSLSRKQRELPPPPRPEAVPPPDALRIYSRAEKNSGSPGMSLMSFSQPALLEHRHSWSGVLDQSRPSWEPVTRPLFREAAEQTVTETPLEDGRELERALDAIAETRYRGGAPKEQRKAPPSDKGKREEEEEEEEEEDQRWNLAEEGKRSRTERGRKPSLSIGSEADPDAELMDAMNWFFENPH